MHFDGDACFLMERWLGRAGAEGVHTHTRGESRAGARSCVGAARVCVCGGVVARWRGPARGSWRKGEMMAEGRLVGARVARCALRWARWRSEYGAAKGHGAGRRTRGRCEGARATPCAERGEIRGRTRRGAAAAVRGCARDTPGRLSRAVRPASASAACRVRDANVCSRGVPAIARIWLAPSARARRNLAELCAHHGGRDGI